MIQPKSPIHKTLVRGKLAAREVKTPSGNHRLPPTSSDRTHMAQKGLTCLTYRPCEAVTY